MRKAKSVPPFQHGAPRLEKTAYLQAYSIDCGRARYDFGKITVPWREAWRPWTYDNLSDSSSLRTHWHSAFRAFAEITDGEARRPQRLVARGFPLPISHSMRASMPRFADSRQGEENIEDDNRDNT